jgi:hypothetical protein
MSEKSQKDGVYGAQAESTTLLLYSAMEKENIDKNNEAASEEHDSGESSSSSSSDSNERADSSANGPLKCQPYSEPRPQRPPEQERQGKRTCGDCHNFIPVYQNGQEAHKDICNQKCENWETCPTKYLKGIYLLLFFFVDTFLSQPKLLINIGHREVMEQYKKADAKWKKGEKKWNKEQKTLVKESRDRIKASKKAKKDAAAAKKKNQRESVKFSSK